MDIWTEEIANVVGYNQSTVRTAHVCVCVCARLRFELVHDIARVTNNFD